MATENLLKVLNENLCYKSNQGSSEANNIVREEVTVFLSFDISNSTKMKTIYPEKWNRVISVLLDSSRRFPLMDFWKFNGDEVLLRCNIDSIDVLCMIIKQALCQLRATQKAMREHIGDITLKGTVWIALTSNVLSECQKNYSLIINESLDYVGKNIDEGFRLTKCSSVMKVAIDPKIIYILLDTYFELKNSDVRANEGYEELEEEIIGLFKNIHLIGEVCCKGVWDDKPYPVYWYYKESGNNGIQYGEFLNGVHLWRKVTEDLYHGANNDHKGKMDEMFLQVNAKSDVDEIKQKLQLFGKPHRDSNRKTNLYFMVACVNPTTGSVMIFQRSSTRKHLKGVWDFGNVKYRNVTMEEIIKSKYQSMFGININLMKDPKRGNTLKPFGYCTVYRNNLAHNGIMLYATIQTEERMDDNQLAKLVSEHIASSDESLYQKVMFVTKQDIENGLLDLTELTLEEIRDDSYLAEASGGNLDYSNMKKGILHFAASIRGAINEWECTNTGGV